MGFESTEYYSWIFFVLPLQAQSMINIFLDHIVIRMGSLEEDKILPSLNLGLFDIRISVL